MEEKRGIVNEIVESGRTKQDLALTIENIFSTTAWESKDCNRFVERAITLFSGEIDFVGPFVAAFLQYLQNEVSNPKSPLRLLARVHKVFRWSTVLLLSASQPMIEDLGTELPKLLIAQAALLDALKDNKRYERNIRDLFVHRLLRHHPWLVQHYFKVAEVAPAKNLFLLKLLLRHLTRPGAKEEELKSVQPQLVKWYDDVILGSTTKLSDFDRTSLDLAVARVSHDEMKNVVMATMGRLFKRSPAVVLPTLVTLCASLSLDLSRYQPELIQLAISELRAAEDDRRALAAKLVSLVVCKSSDFGACRATVEELTTQVLGKSKSGAMPLWNMRVSFLHAIKACADTPALSSDDMNQLSEVAVKPLLDLIKVETHDTVKQEAIECVGKWVIVCSKPSPNTISALIAGASADLKEKKNLSAVTGYLRVILDLAAPLSPITSDWNQVFGGLTAVLVRHTKQAVAAPAQLRVVGMLSSAALIRLSQERALWYDLLTSDKSCFNDQDLVGKGGVEETTATIHLFRALAATEPEALIRDEKLLGFCRGVVRTTILPVYAARLHALKEISQVLKKESGLSVPLIKAYFSLLHEACPNDVNESSLSPHVFSQALLRLIPTPNSDVLPLILCIAHDPLLRTNELHPATAWRKLVSRWSVDETFKLDKMLVKNGATLRALILGGQGLLSNNIRHRKASIEVLVTVMSRIPLLVTSAILPGIVDILGPDVLLNAGEKEKAIFATPEGTLCDWRPKDEFQAQVVESKNVGRSKAEKKLYGAVDEQWEKKVKAEIAAKQSTSGATGPKKPLAPATGGKKGGASEWEAESGKGGKLAEESRIRKAMKAACDHAATMLHVVERLSQSCVEPTRDYVLPAVLNKLHRLIKTDFVRPAACHTHIALSRCIDGQLCDLASTLARAVQAILIQNAKVFDDPKQVLLVEYALTTLAKISDQAAMGASSFLFILPLISLPIRLSHAAQEGAPEKEKGAENSENAAIPEKYLPGLEAALAVLCRHTDPELVSADYIVEFPVEDMLQLLLHALANIQRLQMECQDSLVDLCYTLTTAQTTFLTGDLGLLHADPSVRLTCLQGIDRVVWRPIPPSVVAKLHFTCHDSDPQVAETANNVWESLGLKMKPDYIEALLPFLSHESPDVRYFAALAIAEGLAKFPETASKNVTDLIALFRASPDEVIETSFGMRQEKEYIWRWTTRGGVASTLSCAAPSLGDQAIITSLFNFFVDTGLRDSNDEVWGTVLEGGLKLIDSHGSSNLKYILPILESYMANLKNPKANNLGLEVHIADRLREGVVVMFGTAARHLTQENSKVDSVVELLVEVLKTPSSSVQKAVAECLAPLMGALKEDAEKFVNILLKRLVVPDYGERKGAAYGLASMVKGLKLSALKKYNILGELSTYVQDKANANARQGAMLAYDRLFAELGSKFEPYLQQILPHLLTCFGDANPDVREATQEASRTIMSHLTPVGVKMVLPMVLASLEEKQWRAKLESIGLIGAMAYCAPQQLSFSLPQIVPALLEVMSDANTKIQDASKKALRMIGGVIRNPEIKKLAPVLLNALGDPTTGTNTALKELMRTSFVHSVDAASLALIIPILRRGLKSSLPATKKMAAQVVGSMCSLISDVKDITHYGDGLMKDMNQILVDPIPDVRSVAAKAMGALYKGIGDNEQFAGLFDSLMESLKKETTSVQRSGAAQGLAQILRVHGQEKAQEVVPELCSLARKGNAIVREAFMGVFQYLPDALGPSFSEFLAQVLTTILDGLSDESGPVRDVSLVAGQELVMRFAESDTELILPPLLDGVQQENWMIRLSSLQLLGCLLLRLCGFSGKLFMDDVDLENKESSVTVTKKEEQRMEDAMGTEKRNEVLSIVFLMQSDVLQNIRQMAWRVWKGVVANSPRMTNIILPTLMSRVISDLACNSDERREAAAACLGDLVSKMGDTVLQQIVPILQEELTSPEPITRLGVCLGLSEVMASAKKVHITAYMVDLIPAVRDALCDEEQGVRRAAGQAFQTLFKNVGGKAIDEIVPSLLEQLDSMEDETDEIELTIQGLREVLTICNKEVLPYLIPPLIQEPITLYHARALSLLAECFGAGFSKYVEEVVTTLLSTIVDDEENRPVMMKAADAVVLHVTQESVQTLIETLCETVMAKERPKQARNAAATLLGTFCAGTKCRFEAHIALILQCLVGLLVDADVEMQETGLSSLSKLLENADKDKLSAKIQYLRHCVQTVTRDLSGRRVLSTVPGFCLKKGLDPLLPMLQHGLMHGSPVIREQAASGLGDLVELTTPEALAPYVIKITGPLIRIVGDRFPPLVKAAILNTLSLLIGKSGNFLKPFLPQLQTTFVKAIRDPSQDVRDRAAVALGQLMTLSKRVDPVVTDLVNSARDENHPGVQTSMFQALAAILADPEIGTKLAKEVLGSVQELAMSHITSSKDSVRKEAARTAGAVLQFDSPQELTQHLQQLCSGGLDWREREGKAHALTACVATCKPSNFGGSLPAPIVDFTLKALNDDNVNVECTAIKLAFTILAFAFANEVTGLSSRVLPAVCALGGSDSPQVRQKVFESLAEFCKKETKIPDAELRTIVAACFSRQTDSSGPVKRCSQEALHYALQYHVDAATGAQTLARVSSKLKDREASDLGAYVKGTIARLVISAPVVSVITSSAEEEPEDEYEDEMGKIFD